MISVLRHPRPLLWNIAGFEKLARVAGISSIPFAGIAKTEPAIEAGLNCRCSPFVFSPPRDECFDLLFVPQMLP